KTAAAAGKMRWWLRSAPRRSGRAVAAGEGPLALVVAALDVVGRITMRRRATGDGTCRPTPPSVPNQEAAGGGQAGGSRSFLTVRTLGWLLPAAWIIADRCGAAVVRPRRGGWPGSGRLFRESAG